MNHVTSLDVQSILHQSVASFSLKHAVTCLHSESNFHLSNFALSLAAGPLENVPWLLVRLQIGASAPFGSAEDTWTLISHTCQFDGIGNFGPSNEGRCL